MPSQMVNLKKRPNSVKVGGLLIYFAPKYWKGAGKYYHRGKGVWQKYSVAIDRKRTGSTKIGRFQKGKSAHIGDSYNERV